MKRRSCSSFGRPCHAGCFWSVRKGPRSPRLDDLLHRRGAEGADQLVLQVGDADVEAEPLHLDTCEMGPEARALEAAPELALLCGVAQAREPGARPLRAEPAQEAFDRLRATDGHDGDSLGLEIPTTPRGERLERDLVADALDEHDGTGLDTCAQRVHGSILARER